MGKDGGGGISGSDDTVPVIRRSDRNNEVARLQLEIEQLKAEVNNLVDVAHGIYYGEYLGSEKLRATLERYGRLQK